MNIPSKPGGNWSWRLPRGVLTQELAEKLALMTEVTDREAPANTAVGTARVATDLSQFAV